MTRPKIIITRQMIDEAKALVTSTQVNRTVASPYDTLAGHLGEFAVAQYLYGDWKMHQVGNNRANVDFIEEDIEVKTSAFPFRENLNLLVREDYAIKRTPSAYVQVIVNLADRNQSDIYPGTEAIICGWATSDEVKNAPLQDMGSKFGRRSGYRCRAIPIGSLNDIASLPRKATPVRNPGR